MTVEQALRHRPNDGRNERSDGRSDGSSRESVAGEKQATVSDVATAAGHADLRALVTRWSTSTDSPYRRLIVKKLGDRVEISDVVRTPVAAVELQARTTEIVRTAFEIPAPDATDLIPLAASLEIALPLLPPFAPPADRLLDEAFQVEEDVDHLAWAETVACPDCTGGRVSCATCAGDGGVTCSCGSGTVAETVEEIVTCPVCSGGGKSEARTCTPCGGAGSTQCSTCWGTRRRADRHPCDRCQNGTTVCAHCGGTGEVFGRCLKCAGAGTLPMQVVRQVECPVCGGTAMVACAECYAGRRPCKRCKASGSLVRGERVRRTMRVDPAQRMTSDGVTGLSADPLAVAIPFAASDLEAAGGVAARLADTPALAEEFLEVVREAIRAGATISGRYGSIVVITFTARLGTWCASFAAVEATAERSIECTTGIQPPVDPKLYSRWIAKENAARTAEYEEAAASADAIYLAAMGQYKKEIAAAAVASAPAPTSASASAPKPAAAGASKWSGLKWSEDADARAAERPAEAPKERRGGLGLRGLLRGRRREDAPSQDESVPYNGDTRRLDSTEPVSAVTPAPAMPAPVRRYVAPPELLPTYTELPPDLRIA